MSTMPIKAVSAVVIRDGSVLLVKRANEPFKNTWNLPGGKIEAGESDHGALRREIMEESNLTLLSSKYIGRVSVENYELNVYKANVATGMPKAGSDVSEAEFIPLSSLATYGLPEKTIEMINKAKPKHSFKGHLKTAFTALLYGLGAYSILYILMKVLKISGFQSF